MKRLIVIAFAAAPFLIAPTMATAQQAKPKPKQIRKDLRKNKKDKRDARKDLRDAKKDKRDARKDLRDSRKDLRDAKKDGTVVDKRKAKRDIRDAKRDRRDAKRDIREARRDHSRANRKVRRDHTKLRKAWRAKYRKRAEVTSFSPRRKEVVIRGRNFPANAVVKIGGKKVKAKILPGSIVVKGPAAGPVVVVVDNREHYAGEYKGAKDPLIVDRRKRRAERRKRANKRWKARWKARKKDREARRKAHRERMEELRATRAERAAERAAAIRAKFEAKFLASEAVRAEFALYAGRRARLHRMRRLAEVDDRDKLALRIEILLVREDDRHERRMVTLRANFKG